VARAVANGITRVRRFENGAKEIESRFTRNGKTAELLNPRLPALQKRADECDAVCRIAVGIAAFCQKY
jgi:hypothetical protein